MGKKVGTPAELDLRVGDVVEWLEGGVRTKTYVEYTVVGVSDGRVWVGDEKSLAKKDTFRVVSRAIDTPKSWGDMTDAEQGALLLAHQRGKVIEWSYALPWKTAHSSDQSPYKPYWCAGAYYRVRPEPKAKTETVWYSKIGATVYDNDGWAYSHKITFELVDGEPDVSTVKMEKL